MTLHNSEQYLNFAINYLHNKIEANQGDMITFPQLMIIHMGMKQAEKARNYLLKNHKWDKNCKEIIPHIKRGLDKAQKVGKKFSKNMFKYNDFE